MPAVDRAHAHVAQAGRARIAHVGGEIFEGGHGVDQVHGTADAADHVAHLRFAHAHGGGPGEARIAAPGPAAVAHRRDAAFDEQPRRGLAQPAGLQARTHGGGRIGEHAAARASRLGVHRERFAQTLRGAVLGFDESTQRFDQGEAFDALRRGRRDQRRGRAAHRMPEQREGRPAQRVGRGQHGARGGDERVLGRRRQVGAGAVARQVERDEVEALQMRRDRHEARGVVEPAVQRQHARAAMAPAQRGETAEGGVEVQLPHQSARCSSRRAIAASTRACSGRSLRQGM